MSHYNLAAVRFRAYQADENEDSAGGGGGGGTTGGGGTGPISSIHDGLFAAFVGGAGKVIWETYNDSELGPYTSIPADTWIHLSWAETFHAGATVTVDDAVTVNGTLLFSRSGQDTGLTSMPNAVIFGDDGTGFVSGQSFYLDDATVDGVLIDAFDGTDFSAWDAADTSVQLSTDQAHSGSQSLKVTPPGGGATAMVQHNMVIADGETHTLDCWVYLPTAYLTALGTHGSADFAAFVLI